LDCKELPDGLVRLELLELLEILAQLEAKEFKETVDQLALPVQPDRLVQLVSKVLPVHSVLLDLLAPPAHLAGGV